MLNARFHDTCFGVDDWTVFRIAADQPRALARLCDPYKKREKLRAIGNADEHLIKYVKALCELGVDPREPDEHGATAADNARREGRMDVVAVLESYTMLTLR